MGVKTEATGINMESGAHNPRLLLVAIGCISAAAIGYEILLMRLLSIVQWHHFAYMIISLALLGYGASGTFIALTKEHLLKQFPVAFVLSTCLFGLSLVGCFALAQRLPFNGLELVWDPRQLQYLAALYLLLFIPFFCAATCIGLAFTHRRGLISRIYFADLTGAGLGALSILLALFFLEPENGLRLLAGLVLLAAALVCGERGLRLPEWVAPLLGIGALAVPLILPSDWIALHMSEFKGLSQARQVMGAKILSEHSSPLGLLTVVENTAVPFREAPGLSLRSQLEPPSQLGVFTDGDALSVITQYRGRREELAYLDQLTSALPYHLLQKPKVLILGAGGGSEVLQAHYHQASVIDAVELNPQFVELVRHTHADFAGRLYQMPGINIHIDEARGFIASGQERYDLIQVAMLDSFSASSAGVHALSENYLYTIEAIQEYLRHLTPEGLLAITRWLKLPPRDSLKLFATAIDALRGMGAEHPEQRLALIRGWNTTTLVIKKGELTLEEIATLRRFCDQRSFDPVYYADMPRANANRFNILDEPYLYDGATALLGDAREQFIQRYKFQITPATDNQPYFFHFFKWRVLPELLAKRDQSGVVLVEWGYLVLVATLLQALLLSVILIVLPLWWGTRGTNCPSRGRLSLYFLLLGLAFLFIEMAFIQKFTLFLSHPLYAVAVVLAAFLVFAGLGSAYSARLEARHRNSRLPPIAMAAVAIIAIAWIYLYLLPEVFYWLMLLSDIPKILLSIALIAPLAFYMGMPFPLGLSKVAETAPQFIPWAWGINGVASVLSAVLAALLAIHFGFTVVIGLALVFYLLAAAILYEPI